jgi:hypothetical protein
MSELVNFFSKGQEEILSDFWIAMRSPCFAQDDIEGGARDDKWGERRGRIAASMPSRRWVLGVRSQVSGKETISKALVKAISVWGHLMKW